MRTKEGKARTWKRDSHKQNTIVSLNSVEFIESTLGVEADVIGVTSFAIKMLACKLFDNAQVWLNRPARIGEAPNIFVPFQAIYNIHLGLS